jgi:purine-nucleoside/S-methyl-5'-thioadenosine phosphorylase / adenosine deaminase
MAVLYNFWNMMSREVAVNPPVPAAGFGWAPAPWGIRLVAEALAAVNHGWTTRQLQLRGAAEVERAGWAMLADVAGVSPAALLRMHQVHGAAVHRATARDAGVRPREADIISTEDCSIALAVQVADCVPLLLASSRTGRVAAAHAGWRGTAANVAGVAAAEFDPDASVIAAIGPSIGPCCYRVGTELRTAFEASGWSPTLLDQWLISRDGVLYLDLWQANTAQLRDAGVAERNIHISRLCTACHPDWFCSYRRDGPETGRLAGFIRSAKG